jgi:hypothetical protein
MDVLDEFRWQARSAFDWLESIVRDVTAAQAAWRPPGRANTIAATYAHIVRNIDEDLNHWLFERPMLADTTWRGRTGLAPGLSDFDPEHRIDWDALHVYGRAMCGFAVQTVDALTDADLDRPTGLSTPDIPHWRGIDIIRLTVGHHPRLHGGEIACLKGLQGEKGYTFGLDATRP